MKPYVWIGSLATATAVGYLRYDAGLHYPSDVIVGALVGGSVAYLVPRLHRRSARRVAIVPAVAGDRVGVLVSIDRSRPW
jgi:membrane-associated phospholipid phosphatase